MRTTSSLCRLCYRNAFRRLRQSLPRQQRHPTTRWQGFHSYGSWKPVAATPGSRKILLVTLSPAAFVSLSEESDDDGKTPEEHMLEASREELQEQKRLPDSVHGLRRAWRALYLFVDRWVYEPLATGFRFLHLVIIFVPVIVTIPAIWIGRRQKNRDDERSGTLWWYGFLVHSMERAGPTFIKVSTPMCTQDISPS